MPKRDADAMFYGSHLPGAATVSSIWDSGQGWAVRGVVSVLFTADRRVFFEHDDGTIRIATDWARDEVLLQMLSWPDAAAKP
jgi:hypothetical protein